MAPTIRSLQAKIAKLTKENDDLKKQALQKDQQLRDVGTIKTDINSLAKDVRYLRKKPANKLVTASTSASTKGGVSLDKLARSTLNEILGGRISEKDTKALERVLNERFVIEEESGHKYYRWNPSATSVGALSGVAALSGRQAWLVQAARGQFDTINKYLPGLELLGPIPRVDQDDIDAAKERIKGMLNNLEIEFRNPDLRASYVVQLLTLLDYDVNNLLANLEHNDLSLVNDTDDERKVINGELVKSGVDSLSTIFYEYKRKARLNLGDRFYKLTKALNLVFEQTSDVREVLDDIGFGESERKSQEFPFGKEMMTPHGVLELSDGLVEKGKTLVQQGEEDGLIVLKIIVKELIGLLDMRPKTDYPFSDDLVEESFVNLDKALKQVETICT